MDTEDKLRQELQVFVRFGVTQRALADRLLVSESWLSRWLHPHPNAKVRPITVPQMDRFRAYVREFKKTLEESQRSASQPDTAGGLQDTGTADKP
jgi:transcriptional regulator with XRE-family HTH domain